MDWVSIVDKGGVIAVLILVVWTGSKGVWVWKREVEQREELIVQITRDRDEWKNLAWPAIEAANKAVELAERRRGR